LLVKIQSQKTSENIQVVKVPLYSGKKLSGKTGFMT
jgi:hypothetical protein